MKRRFGRAATLFVSSATYAIWLAPGCGLENALVGGQCAQGYIECDLHCVKTTSCNSPPDAAGAIDGPQPDSTSAVDSPAAGDGDDEGASNDAASDGTIPGEAGPMSDATDADVEADVGTGADASADGGADGGADASADASADAGAIDANASEGDGPAADSESDSTDAEGAVDSSDASPEDAGADASSRTDASEEDADDGEAGNPCTPPLVFCGQMCIDVSADPLNCGACSVVCASQLCESARCVGAASGGIVYAGHDYTTTLPGTAQARVLSNAVFIPQANPLNVMSYERYASASAISHVNSILGSVASQVGRTLTLRHTVTDTDIPTQLALPSYDVLLIHDQPTAPDGALGALGTSWAATLTTFTLGGGIVVVLDGGTGIQQMPAFASGTGLLTVVANSPVTLSTPLIVSSRVDVVGIGVISPYGAGQNTVSVTTEPNAGNVVYVVEISTDAGSGAPVIVHKAF